MRGPHFSLRWMFGFVSFLAVGCGLLVYASPILSRLTVTATLVALLTSVLAAVSHAGERRMFWAGFAAFGLAYAWVVCGSWQSPDGNWLRERLATTAILQWCHERAPHTRSSTTTMPSPGMGMMGPMGGSMAGGPMMMGNGIMPGGGGSPGMGPPTGTLVNQAPDWGDFVTTGHSLFELAFAMLGGLIASGCYRRAKQTDCLRGQP